MERTYTPAKKGLRIITRNRFSLLAGILGKQESLSELLPPLIRRGKGPYLYDYDGNRYVDFYLSHGSLTLGHTPAGVTKIMKSWLSKGFSPGYLAGSHALIAKKLADTLTVQTGIPDRGRVWLFYDSACQAVSALAGLLRLADVTGEWVYMEGHELGPDFRDRPPGFSKKILPSETRGAELPPSSCVFVRPGVGCGNAGIIRELSGKGVLVITDETRLESFLHLHGEPDECARVGLRVFGEWAAAGSSFGCICVAPFFAELIGGRMDGERFSRFFSLLAEPPLYKIKAAAAAADLLAGGGGIDGIIAKNRRFFRLLGDRHFSFCDGMVYMKQTPAFVQGYRKLYGNLLRSGFFFPLSPEEPLHTSVSHPGDLLHKAAPKIRSLFDAFFR
jgi:hypothetical protein